MSYYAIENELEKEVLPYQVVTKAPSPILLNFINKLIVEYENALTFNESERGVIYSFVQRILRSKNIFARLGRPLIKVVESIKKHNSLYYVSAANRMYSLEFLKTLITEPDLLNECAIFYKDRESLSVLNKFFRNKLYCALYSSIPKRHIFTNEDVFNININNAYYKKNVKEFKNQFFIDGFYFLKPFSFETSVFVEKCGIPYLNSKTIQHMDGIIVDCGAYVGDSSIIFGKIFPKNIIWAIEFSKPNCDLLQKNLKKNNLEKNIKSLNLAVGSETKTIEICHSFGLNIRQETKGKSFDKVRMVTLDNLCKDEKISLIKMDIEGSEMDALIGAKQTIIKNRPVLLLSVYHIGSDIFKIPDFINNLKLNYSFKLRHLKPESPSIDYMLICEPN